jgi:hypothetical protein
MSEKQYLILSPDGSRSSIFLTNREGLERHLAEKAKFVEEDGGWQTVWLDQVRTAMGGYGTVHPGGWDEVEELILEVTVVVPQAVTVKWQIP